MIDREKVIKGLSILFDNCGCIASFGSECDVCPYKNVNGCVDQIIKEAIILLKAQDEKVVNLTTKIAELTTLQEPVKPTEPDEDNMRYCGVCGSPVGYEVLEAPGIEYVQYSYCPECGREVNWDG